MTSRSLHEGIGAPENKMPFCNIALGLSQVSGRNNVRQYTDADLAADMNALSFKERQAMEEDIHGVSDATPETEDFVNERIGEMKNYLKNMPNTTKRDAWDRAVFLRPALSSDRALYLMFLRARRFDAFDAANLLVKFYEMKRLLYGDDLLIHRIRWSDLKQEEQDYATSGIYQLAHGYERAGRGVGFHQFRRWDVTIDPKVVLRSCIFLYMTMIQDNTEMQQKGIVSIFDFRGTWTSSKFQMAQYLGNLAQYSLDSLPHHLAATHLLYDEPTFETFIQKIRSSFTKGHRIRNRVHFGSGMEISYALKTFGINLPNVAPVGEEGSVPKEELLKEIRRRDQIEEERREFEKQYRDPTSPVALYPNLEDIIMGRNKKIARTWPGNVNFQNVVSQQAFRYLEQEDRSAKYAVSVETIKILVESYKARFLIRKEDRWEIVDDAAIHQKVSQALQKEVRIMTTQSKDG